MCKCVIVYSMSAFDQEIAELSHRFIKFYHIVLSFVDLSLALSIRSLRNKFIIVIYIMKIVHEIYRSLT
jgi:hypothetical protein